MTCFVSVGTTSLDGLLDVRLLVHVQENQSWTKWTFRDGWIRLRESSLKRLQQQHKISGRERVKVRVLKSQWRRARVLLARVLLRARDEHDGAWSPAGWVTLMHVLRYASELRFLQGQILCRLYKTSFGWDYKSRSSSVCTHAKRSHNAR